MELDKIKALFELCRKMGVYHYKSQEIEFTISPDMSLFETKQDDNNEE